MSDDPLPIIKKILFGAFQDLKMNKIDQNCSKEIVQYIGLIFFQKLLK